jgi:peptidoglycan/LPS O-acetylase OafA/YrhL
MQFRVFGFWRLIAAFLVMTYHYVHHAPVNAAIIVAWFERMMPLLDMFFMISGFLIYQRYHDRISTPAAYGAYLLKRLARLYPLHIMTTGFFVLVGLAVTFGFVQSQGSAGGLNRYDWSELPVNLLLVQGWGLANDLTFNYVSWSLSAEWFCYLLLPVIIGAARFAGLAGLFALLGLVIAALEISVITGFLPHDDWKKTSTWGAYRAFADFIIGAIICTLYMRSKLTIRSTVPAWLLMIATVVGMHMGNPAYISFALIAVALFLAAVAERNAPERTAMLDIAAPVSNVSFGIYLWHPVMEAIFLSLVWRHLVGPAGWMDFYLFLLIPMVVTVFVSLLSFQLVERPANNAILNFFGFRRDRQATGLQPAE